MRQNEPVFFDPEMQVWNVFRYEDAIQVLSNPKIFSSQFIGGRGDSPISPFAVSMISSDPPRHRQLRGLVSQAFTPKAVESLAPRIQKIVQEQLDHVAPEGKMDVIYNLGYPLPVIVIAEMLGIPSEDRDRFKNWSDLIVSMSGTMGGAFGSGDMKQFTSSDAILEMGTYFLAILEQRRRQPSDDLISGLLAAEIDGQHLSEMELLGACFLLLVAGNETTTNLIGNALLTFTERPQDWDRLREAPDLLPEAIEEILRYRSPVQSVLRYTNVETSLGVQVIRAEEPVKVWIGSANHDEAQFKDPENFDIQRSPNKHIAFGQGIHYCLGAPLARLEARIALGAMLERFYTVERVSEVRLERLPSNTAFEVFGVPSLPIRFTER
jgi:cytochrome P450